MEAAELADIVRLFLASLLVVVRLPNQHLLFQLKAIQLQLVQEVQVVQQLLETQKPLVVLMVQLHLLLP